MYTVEDHEDADREDVLIDSFETLEEAEKYAREWSESYGHCTIHDGTGSVVKTIRPYLTDEQKEFAETAIRGAFESFFAQVAAGATDGFLNHDATSEGWREFLSVNVVGVTWAGENPFTKADLQSPAKLHELAQMCNDLLSEVENEA